MAANYDSIASIYDFTSRLVFGGAIVKAQVCMMQYIPPHSRILIVGGGTGWILEKIAAQHTEGLEIDYVESSVQMVSLSEKRDYKRNDVNFIQLPIEAYDIAGLYDIIITPFIFDNFKKDKLELVFHKLDAALKSNGLWLYADFVYDKRKTPFWQKLLLKVMYFFFRITTGIETRELISMDSYFAPYHIEFKASHYFRFMQSLVYRKQ